MELITARLCILLLLAFVANSATINRDAHKEALPNEQTPVALNDAAVFEQGHENVGGRKVRHFSFGNLDFGVGFGGDFGYTGYGDDYNNQDWGYGGYGYDQGFGQFGQWDGYFD